MINGIETKMYYQHKLFSLSKNWGIQHDRKLVLCDLYISDSSHI